MQHITRDRKPNYELALKIANSLCEEGIKFDPEKLTKIYNKYKDIELDLNERLNQIAGYNVNVNSVNQVRKLIEGLLVDYAIDGNPDLEHNEQIKVAEDLLNKYFLDRKKGKFSSNSDKCVKAYAELGIEAFSLIPKIRSAHSYQTKIISPSSGKGLLDSLDGDNRVHPTPSLGETFRIAYANPGLSNLSAEIKHCEAPKDDEYELYELDYSQQELYIMACWWNIQAFKEELANTPDGYTALAKSVLNIQVLSPEFRDKVKTAWLAKSYGAGVPTIAVEVGRDFAKSFVSIIEAIPEYANVRQDIEVRIKAKDCTATSYFGTTRDLTDQLRIQGTGYVKRAMLNNPVQTTGSDILSFVLEDVTDFIQQNNLQGLLRICYTVYDSVILEVKKGYQHLLEELKDLITYQIDDWLPINLKISKLSE